MSEQPKDPERETYRHALAVALNEARKFDGTEASADQVIDAAAEFERVVREILDIDEGAVPEESEHEVAEVFDASLEYASVDGLIDQAVDVFKRKIERKMNELNLRRKQMDKQFFPPGDLLKKDGEGEGARETQSRIVPRLPLLLPELMRRQIYLDDIVIYEGKIESNQWRNSPYYILEIPRLRAQILICDEVGEQTYLVKDLMSPDVYAEKTKSDLLESFPAKVTPIRFQKKWATLLCDELFKENVIAPKVSLDYRDQLKEDILRQYPNPETWMAQSTKARRSLTSLGRKLISIASHLGADPSWQPYLYVDFLKLGRLIYGAENPVLNERIALEEGNQDEWRKVLKHKYPNAEALLKVKAHKFPAIHDRRLRAIINVLGIQTFVDVDSDLVDMISLAEFLFPGAKAVIEKKKEYLVDYHARDELKNDSTIFIDAIKDEYPRAKDFLSEKVHKLGSKRFLDLKLPSILSVVAGGGAKNLLFKDYLNFAKIIYDKAEDQEYIDYVLYIESIIDQPEKVKAEIRKIKASSGEWPKYKKALDTFNLGRYSLKVLFTKLGVDDPSLGRGRDIIIYHDFLMAVYPDEDLTELRVRREALREARFIRDSLGMDRSKWTAYFQDLYPNYQAWLDAGFDRLVGSRSLVWIAKNVYGIEPPSYRNTRITLENYKVMGRMIFPE